MRNDVADSAAAPASARLSEPEAWRFLLPPLILAVAILWCVPMGTSLGLDESGNWWVLKDGIRTMFERARIWPGGQSILFNLLVIAARAIGGDSDIAMRVPTLLLAVATLPVLYRLGARLASPLAGMFACLAFVTMGEVVYVASVVRPYSLAIFLVSLTMLMLIRWLDTGRWSYGAAYAIFSALTLYATVLYATMFLVHAVYAVYRIRGRAASIGYAKLAAAWIASGILMLPLLRQVLASLAARGEDSYLGIPSMTDILASVAPPLLAGSIALGLLLAALFKRPIAAGNPPRKIEIWPAVLWGVTPPAAILALSLFTDIHLFAARYFLANAPGVALAAGIALSLLTPAGTGRLIAGCMVLAAILNQGVDQRFERGLHDFRGAVTSVRDMGIPADTPVLVVGSFTESRSVENLRNPVLFDVMFSPELRYHLPGHIIGLPINFSDEGQAYLESIFSSTLRTAPRFVFLGPLSAEFYRTWLLGRGQESGFVIRSQSVHGGMGVVLFERASAR